MWPCCRSATDLLTVYGFAAGLLPPVHSDSGLNNHQFLTACERYVAFIGMAEKLGDIREDLVDNQVQVSDGVRSHLAGWINREGGDDRSANERLRARLATRTDRKSVV